MVYGNADKWARFERDCPSAAILNGPAGVGKFTGASEVAYRLAGVEDVVRFQKTTVKDVRELITWFKYRSDTHKIAIVEPGPCHPNVWTMLKTLIEALPENAHLWIIDSYAHRAPKGIQDRAFRYHFDLLTADEMGTFLAEADTLLLDLDYVATLGSVDRVMAMNTALQHKPAVANWITAVEESNRDLLLIASRAWEEQHTVLLIAELEAQLAGTTVVEGKTFQRVSKEKLRTALTLLQDGRDPGVTALGTAFSMMVPR